jgi:hypothetical protein
MKACAIGLVVAVTVLSSAAEPLKSGPPVGTMLEAFTFQPLNITGPDAGKKQCLV